MAEGTIKVRDNGPYVITGDVTVTDSEGNAFTTQETIVLCRCGHSGNKPFCDGQHRANAFESTPRAQA
ncbi:MAG: CDGSH iron-sulfur domain-containing protein [Dehalococcoidia bacterium]